jgi:hypothetical protein
MIQNRKEGVWNEAGRMGGGKATRMGEAGAGQWDRGEAVNDS